jgi:hypothetical protein
MLRQRGASGFRGNGLFHAPTVVVERSDVLLHSATECPDANPVTVGVNA